MSEYVCLFFLMMLVMLFLFIYTDDKHTKVGMISEFQLCNM